MCRLQSALRCFWCCLDFTCEQSVRAFFLHSHATAALPLLSFLSSCKSVVHAQGHCTTECSSRTIIRASSSLKRRTKENGHSMSATTMDFYLIFQLYQGMDCADAYIVIIGTFRHHRVGGAARRQDKNNAFGSALNNFTGHYHASPSHNYNR